MKLRPSQNSRDDVKNELNEKVDQKEFLESIFDPSAEKQRKSIILKGVKELGNSGDGYDNIQNELKDIGQDFPDAGGTGIDKESGKMKRMRQRDNRKPFLIYPED